MLFLKKKLWCRAGTKLHWAVQPVDLMGQGATVSLSLPHALGVKESRGAAYHQTHLSPCSGSVTEWHWNIQEVPEIAEKLKLHVVATKVYLKIFDRLQGDPSSLKRFFPQNAYSLSMINDLYKICDSTTSSGSKTWSEKVCCTNGYETRARNCILSDTTDYLCIDAATQVDWAHG